MVRIVSGQQEYQDPGLAFLKGWEGGEERKRKARQDQQEEMKLMLTIQKAMGDYASEQQKMLADINARAQMGDAMALQQQMLEAQAAGAPIEEKMMKEFVGSLGNIKDPDARAKAVPVFMGLLGEVEKQKKREATVQSIQRAGANGLIDPEQWMARVDSGEQYDALTKELGDLEQRRNIEVMAQTKNAKALEQGRAFVDSMPDGNQKLMGEYVLTAYQNNAAGQSDPQAGIKLMDDLRSIAAKIDEPLLTRQQIAGQKPAPGLPGMTAGQRNEELGRDTAPPAAYQVFQDVMGLLPGIPQSGGLGVEGPRIPEFTGGTHKTLKELAKKDPARLAAGLAQEIKDPDKLAAKLKSLGVRLTPSLVAQIQGAQNASGSAE